MPLNALNLPFEPIKELGDYWCEVTVRNVDFFLFISVQYIHVAPSSIVKKLANTMFKVSLDDVWLMHVVRRTNTCLKLTNCKFGRCSTTTLILYIVTLQVNGISTVRIPMSLLPYEDQSAHHQKQLKRQKQLQAEAADEDEVSETAAVEAAKDSESAVGDASKTTASATPATQGQTAPPSDRPGKD